MKYISYFILLTMLFLSGCHWKIKSDSYNENLIIEGVCVNGVFFGDDVGKVESVFGKPVDIYYNQYFTDMNTFFTNRIGITYYDTFLSNNLYNIFYIDINPVYYVFIDQPFFKYAYAYPENGINIYFNDSDKVVEFIIIFSDELYADDENIPYSKYTGRLYFSGTDTDTTMDKIFGLKNDLHLKNITKNHPSFDCSYYYNTNNQLMVMSMFSPIIGGRSSLYGMTDHIYSVMYEQEQWIEENGEKYIRGRESLVWRLRRMYEE